MVGNLEELVGPPYTPEEQAFISGWEAVSIIMSEQVAKSENLENLKTWLESWHNYAEYDNCMDAMYTWQEKITKENDSTK